MVQRHRWAAAMLFVLVVSALAMLFAPSASHPAALVAAGAVAVALALAGVLAGLERRYAPATGPVRDGRPGDHAVFVAIDDPDSPGRPRPRAPGQIPAWR